MSVVFDVPDEAVGDALLTVEAAGFAGRRYYPADRLPTRGGARPGWTRLGAERRSAEFTEAEQQRVVAAFEAIGLSCVTVGVESWTAGDRPSGDGPAGVREPRRPLPRAGAGSATAQ